MLLSALLTSAGINVGLCALMVSLYSVLRRQPENFSVYFGRRLAEETGNRVRGYFFERLVPSPTWILKAWEYTEDDILMIAGLDAVVFLRILVFSMRIFSIAAVVCVFGVLPLNYFGQEMRHRQIPSESLDVFTIANVKEGSQCRRQLWLSTASWRPFWQTMPLVDVHTRMFGMRACGFMLIHPGGSTGHILEMLSGWHEKSVCHPYVCAFGFYACTSGLDAHISLGYIFLRRVGVGVFGL